MREGNFDYQPLNEQDEHLSFDKLKKCPHCGKPIPSDSTMCLYCGEECYYNKKPSWVVITAIVLAIIILIVIFTTR